MKNVTDSSLSLEAFVNHVVISISSLWSIYVQQIKQSFTTEADIH